MARDTDNSTVPDLEVIVGFDCSFLLAGFYCASLLLVKSSESRRKATKNSSNIFTKI